MTLVKSTTITADFRDKIIAQFKNKPNIAAILGALLDQVQDLEDAFFQVLIDTRLGQSVGEQLDGLGQIVGEERQGRSDIDYALAISVRILLNISSATLEEILAIVVSMVGPTFVVTTSESFPAEFDITIDEKGVRAHLIQSFGTANLDRLKKTMQ